MPEMTPATPPLTAEEEADIRASGDWCVSCGEYRNPEQARLIATLDRDRAARDALPSVERLADRPVQTLGELLRRTR